MGVRGRGIILAKSYNATVGHQRIKRQHEGKKVSEMVGNSYRDEIGKSSVTTIVAELERKRSPEMGRSGGKWKPDFARERWGGAD